MNKAALMTVLSGKLQEQLNVLKESALAAHGAATHPESQAEDKYDTRGLEASYLADAQSRRANELEQLITFYAHLELKAFGPNTPIASTALIELESNGKQLFYFLIPKGGGISLNFEGKKIHTVTPQSPIGEALLDRLQGDEIEITIQASNRDYEIIKVW